MKRIVVIILVICTLLFSGCAVLQAMKGGTKEAMTYYVYILTNKNKNVLYVGVTNDLIRRIYEHKHHMDKESFTSKYNVVNLVYFEETSDVKSAIEREKQLKSWSRMKKFMLVKEKNPTMEDIYSSLLY